METKVITFKVPKVFAIPPFVVNHYKNKGNEIVWLANSSVSLTILKIRVTKDNVIAECEGALKCLITTKGSRSSNVKFVLGSNCKTNKEIVNGIKDNSIVMTWRCFNGRSQGEIPSEAEAIRVLESVDGNWKLNEEQIGDDGTVLVPGLRAPQIGAIYSILSNWIVSRDPATVVLPTGLGKSETILGAIIARTIPRSLIIVPSDSLRDQFFDSCIRWGILRKIKILGADVLNPVVAKITSSKSDNHTFKSITLSSNIIVATASILNILDAYQIQVLQESCEAIFIDEAHHSAAPTWERLKHLVDGRKIIQFTATPFREDKKPITGKIIFEYSLEDAQRKGYFTKIDFIPVVDYDSENWDKTISEKAIDVLKLDLRAGHNHFLMARVDNIRKATEIFEKYYRQYEEFNPLLITSKEKQTKELIHKLRTGESRIVVCVNMLGEGMDIPELKIAALHDIRKSLTITLQFVGRFTRSNKSAASAKIIANIADVKIEKKLKELYKENADWGKLIAFASAKEIQSKIKFQKLLANFKDSRLPLFNIKPKLSATVYHTRTDEWSHEALDIYLESEERLFITDYNETDNVKIAIYQDESNIDWLDSNDFIQSTWELLLFYFDKTNKLLYVNSSVKSVDEELITGLTEVVIRYDRETPFKVYHGLGHVVLFTLGLDKNTDSPIKYAMYAGDDVYEGITEMEKNRSSKSNTYGYGFANGEEITLGASKNGKIWSRLVGNVQEWIDWCNWIGSKLTDSSIDIDAIFKGFLQPKRFVLSQLKELERPISIDWPNSFYLEVESKQVILINGVEVNLFDITLSVKAVDSGYLIEMTFVNGAAYLNLIYTEQAFEWRTTSADQKIEYRRNKKTVDFLQFLSTEDCFKIRLIDGTFVENNYHFKPYKDKGVFPLDASMLTSFDWGGVELNRESMGLVKPFITTSIQFRVFDRKRTNGIYDVIFNDDEAGEAADLLCFGLDDDQLLIEAIHCKYMLKTDRPGSRLSDFYELCGQAQKNIKSFSNVLRLFDHIKSRETKAMKKNNIRFLKGDLRQLELLIKSNSYRRPKLKVTLVQPALAKEKVSGDLLEMIGSTYSLLKETLNCDFEVLCSK